MVAPVKKAPVYTAVQAGGVGRRRPIWLSACSLCGALVHDPKVHTPVCPGV